jgi:hypothetical protein
MIYQVSFDNGHTGVSRAAAKEALESERQTWQREKTQLQLRLDELLILLKDARQVSFADI